MLITDMRARAATRRRDSSMRRRTASTIVNHIITVVSSDIAKPILRFVGQIIKNKKTSNDLKNLKNN